MLAYGARLLCVPMAVSLSGCLHEPVSSGSTPPAATERLKVRTLSMAEVAMVHAGVRRSLKDPDSAKFGQIVAGDAHDGTTACLLVNAKNSYGGYTGMKPMMGIFVGKPPSQFVVADGGNRRATPKDIDEATYILCEKYGLSLMGAI